MTASNFRGKARRNGADAPASARRSGRPALALLIGLVLLWHIPTHARQATTRQTAAHLLEQSTFGPTAADVDLVLSSGYDQWLNNQFAMAESPMPDDPDVNDVRDLLLLNMAGGQDQLRQRMMFALSQIIVVSANKNGSGDELTPWVRLLSRNAFGNYRTLLREIVLSPTMGKYLDMAYSRCTRNTTTVRTARRRPCPTRTMPARCCSCSRLACGSSTPTAP